jgi:hypothetical protein
MPSRTSQQLTRILTVSGAILGLGTAPLLAVIPTPRAPVPEQRDVPPDSDQWMELLLQFLRGLKGMVESETQSRVPTDTATSLVNDIIVGYQANGIAPNTDDEEGRTLVRSTCRMLTAAPDLIDLNLRATFSQTLLAMYLDLHGDPLDLLGILP